MLCVSNNEEMVFNHTEVLVYQVYLSKWGRIYVIVAMYFITFGSYVSQHSQAMLCVQKGL